MDRREKMINQTVADWRQLGFFYDRDDTRWLFVGDKSGLSKLAELLRKYASDPLHVEVGHEHYGPYMYLEIGTWSEPQVNDHWISGPVDHLLKLADLIESRLSETAPGDNFVIWREYAPSSEMRMEFDVKPDGFDPAELDAMDWSRNVKDGDA
jgi:hypothetical protein